MQDRKIWQYFRSICYQNTEQHENNIRNILKRFVLHKYEKLWLTGQNFQEGEKILIENFKFSI